MKPSIQSHLPVAFPKIKDSHCMALSKAGELERVKKLSVEQRILSALSLREQLGEMKPVSISNHG